MSYPGLGLIIVGLILWFLGGHVFVPLVLFGQILVVIGVIILLLQVVKDHL